MRGWRPTPFICITYNIISLNSQNSKSFFKNSSPESGNLFFFLVKGKLGLLALQKTPDIFPVKKNDKHRHQNRTNHSGGRRRRKPKRHDAVAHRNKNGADDGA